MSESPALQVHPVADLFPMLPDDEVKELATDISERGLLQAIVIWVDGDGQRWILDGRNRLRACEIAGVEPEFTTYDGDDPDGFALVVNMKRRNHSDGQKAIIAARALLVSNKTQEQIAADSGVGRSRIAQAKTVLDHAPDLVDAVRARVTSFDVAYDTARQRKKDAAQAQAQMSKLNAFAPDLAEMVADEQLPLDEAYAAYLERTREEREAAEQKEQMLRDEYTRIFEPLHVLATYGRSESIDHVMAEYSVDLLNPPQIAPTPEKLADIRRFVDMLIDWLDKKGATE